MYDDTTLKMETMRSVFLTSEPSGLTKQARRLIAHWPLGRVEVDKRTLIQDQFLFSVAFFFFFSLFAVYFCDQWLMYRALYEGVVLLIILIWILFLYQNDLYFAFCKLKPE